MDLSFDKIRDLLVVVISDNIYYEHDEETQELLERLEDSVREEVQDYLGTMLPATLQTRLISLLVEELELKSPHLVVRLLFSERLQQFSLQLTKPCSQSRARRERGGEARLLRVSERDISAVLETLEEIFTASQPTQFRRLTEFLVVDRSEDPDFQGDPINNMTNTNRDRAGIMGRLETVALHLTLLPALTTLVLPFASNNILAAVSLCPAIRTFQNIYR